jgi:C4-dicarboxylate transporter DctM subunit
MGSILLIVFVVTLFINIPIAVCLGIASVTALLVGESLHGGASSNVHGCEQFFAHAIPFFVWAGNVMASGYFASSFYFYYC